MKPCALLLNLSLAACLLNSCHSNPMMSQATGAPYEIVVISDDSLWESPVGEALKNDLESDVPGLPQSEPAFRIMRTNPNNVGNLHKLVRNIISVNVNDKMFTATSMNYENDRWAKNQTILTLNAPNQQSLVDFLNTHQNALCQFFSKIELQRATQYLSTDFSRIVKDSLQKHLNVRLNAPADMKSLRCSQNFFWTSNNAKTARMDIIVYDFPYTDEHTFTADYLISKRDSVLKANLPGAFPNSYMKTASAHYAPINLHGNYCGTLRGLWEMVGDMMGGPFIAHARLDTTANRIVVAEGFVYAPETNKRNLIRKLEAALYTLQLPNEYDPQPCKNE